MSGGCWTYHGDPFFRCVNVQQLWCTPESSDSPGHFLHVEQCGSRPWACEERGRGGVGQGVGGAWPRGKSQVSGAGSQAGAPGGDPSALHRASLWLQGSRAFPGGKGSQTHVGHCAHPVSPSLGPLTAVSLLPFCTRGNSLRHLEELAPIALAMRAERPHLVSCCAGNGASVRERSPSGHHAQGPRGCQPALPRLWGRVGGPADSKAAALSLHDSAFC